MCDLLQPHSDAAPPEKQGYTLVLGAHMLQQDGFGCSQFDALVALTPADFTDVYGKQVCVFVGVLQV